MINPKRSEAVDQIERDEEMARVADGRSDLVQLATLRACLDAAKKALIDSDADRAIDLCFHMLSAYPESVEVQCLLGEAYREKGLAEAAEAAFRRVLSADPENLIARWAMSILEEEKGDIAKAAWHLWRAFELSPSHAGLRQELSRLWQGDVFLTRGGLGRIYARGELYDRAVAEFEAILAEEPYRLDIQVALAQALLDAGRHDEAGKLSVQILAEHPDCLKANIIAGYVLIVSGEEERGRRYLERAKALDPENAVMAHLLGGLPGGDSFKRKDVALSPFKDISTDSAAEHGAEPEQGSLNTFDTPVLGEIGARHSDVEGVELTREGDETEQFSIPRALQGERRAIAAAGAGQERLTSALEYLEAGKIDQAVKELEIIVRTSPPLIDRAIECLKSIVATRPDNQQALRVLGDAYMKSGRLQQAIDCYNRCRQERTSRS